MEGLELLLHHNPPVCLRANVLFLCSYIRVLMMLEKHRMEHLCIGVTI